MAQGEGAQQVGLVTGIQFGEQDLQEQVGRQHSHQRNQRSQKSPDGVFTRRQGGGQQHPVQLTVLVIRQCQPALHRGEKRQDQSQEKQVLEGQAGFRVQPAFLAADVAATAHADGHIAGRKAEQQQAQNGQHHDGQRFAPCQADVAPGQGPDA